ncbi:leucyl aminopeptidase family protein [Roseomonas elaeocarpi]|uniref:M17 family metallopeptidase n=1 Tax=Roseomonas elaeocarpi TaxID=907779 RepID=A0ABV6JSS2_9PROT
MIALRFVREVSGGGDGEVRRLLPLRPGAAHSHETAARFAGFRAGRGEVAALAAPAPVLLGLGDAGDLGAWEEAGAAAVLSCGRATHAVIDARRAAPEEAAALAAGAALRAWRFGRHRRPDEDEARFPEHLDILVDDPALALHRWEAEEPAIRATLRARDWVAEPGNHLGPKGFTAALEDLTQYGLEVEVLRRKELARQGYGAILAVGGGAAESPRLVVIRWPGDRGRDGEAVAPVVFVGKGITFDTGGISIKPAAGMEEMRADMAGAAAAAGAMMALALRGSRAPAAAVLAIAENATGSGSYRPGDVVRTGSGRTVEVVDTDAEGRMVLADALHHACAVLRAGAVIDLATLTGSVVVALGHHRAGLFGNDDGLRDAVLRAGEATAQPAWPMPIGTRHREDLRSDIADLLQCRPGGQATRWLDRFTPDASHAAAFLREFVGNTPWAHLDIAGVETREEDAPAGPKGPTGFGVRLLDRLVRDRFEPRRRRG